MCECQFQVDVFINLSHLNDKYESVKSSSYNQKPSIIVYTECEMRMLFGRP